MGVQDWLGDFADADGWVELERMEEATDESGVGFYHTGTKFWAYEVKLSAREVFFLGQDAVKPTFRFWADAPLQINEHDRLYHPAWGQLDIISAIRDRLGQGIVTIDAEDVSAAEGE